MFCYFNNMWDVYGDDPIKYTFFTSLLSSVFGIPIYYTLEPYKADILIESVYNHASKSILNIKKWKYSFLFVLESYYNNRNLKAYSCVIGFNKTEQNFVLLPVFVQYLITNPKVFVPIKEVPSKMVGVVIGNPGGRLRNRFLDKLEAATHVVYGGSFRNNHPKIAGAYNSDELVNFYKNFKFVITMENSIQTDYITEKIINGFAAGVIPVYLGAPNVTQYFNKRRFLELTSASDEHINAIIETMITMTDDEYLSRIAEPIFVEPLNNDADSYARILLERCSQEIKTCIQ